MLNDIMLFCMQPVFFLQYIMPTGMRSCMGFFWSFYGSLLCVLICIVLMLLSRRCFSKTFSSSLWKYLLLIVIGGYILIFIAESTSTAIDAFSIQGGDLSEGLGEDYAWGYRMIQVLLGPIVSIVSLCYIISFLRRIRKKVKGDKNNKNEEETSCSM